MVDIVGGPAPAPGPARARRGRAGGPAVRAVVWVLAWPGAEGRRGPARTAPPVRLGARRGKGRAGRPCVSGAAPFTISRPRRNFKGGPAVRYRPLSRRACGASEPALTRREGRAQSPVPPATRGVTDLPPAAPHEVVPRRPAAPTGGGAGARTNTPIRTRRRRTWMKRLPAPPRPRRRRLPRQPRGPVPAAGHLGGTRCAPPATAPPRWRWRRASGPTWPCSTSGCRG